MAEILAPAGTEEAFLAAAKAGADAVYLGGTSFGARAYAGNFDKNTLLHTLDLAHLFGIKIYLTVNTLMKENELEQLYAFLLPYYEAGLDAVIVQDFGAVKRIKECFPDLHIHASTQMTVTGYHGASFLKEYGVDRVVPARELSLAEIRQIRAHSDIEIECFVHGALCYCYSGQCLMSSLAGGRSGNRGRCAQPCRLPYAVFEKGRKLSDAQDAYALNTKDICTLDLLPDLLGAGVDSFKIEGRMKRPEYVAGVTSVYRKYHDLALEGKPYTVKEKDRRFLADLFNREGFSRSYYRQHNGPDMMALHNIKRTEKDNEKTEKAYLFVRDSILSAEMKKELDAQVCVAEGHAELVLSADGIQARAESAEVFPAKTKGLTEEGLAKQLQKTGGTPYEIKMTSVEIAPGVFMTIGAQNELRRTALECYEKKLKERYQGARQTNRRPVIAGKRGHGAEGSFTEHEIDTLLCHNNPDAERILKKGLAVSVITAGQFRAAYEQEDVEEIYLPPRLVQELFPDGRLGSDKAGKKLSLSLPAPLRENGDQDFRELIEKARDAGWGFLAGSFEETAMLLSMGLADRIRLDAGVYMMNSQSAAFMRDAGITKDTVPYELNRHELMKRDNSRSELVVYGRIPLMISAQCLKKTYDTCTRDFPVLTLTDRKNYRYPVFADCLVCRNIIYNPFPVSLLSKKQEARELGAGSFRLIFTDESPKMVDKLIRAWMSGEPCTEGFDFTRGHFGRGIE